MLVVLKRVCLSYGFAIWLWAFVFARIPLAVVQEYSGYDSRPFILINIISFAVAFVVALDRGLKPLFIFKYRPSLLVVCSFLSFWLIYFFRMGFDSFIEPVNFIVSPFDLSKSFIISTLIPSLCMPWILSIRFSVDSLVICSALGNISILTGIIAFFNKAMAMGFNVTQVRFEFADLNPIPAGHSSAALVIFGVILLFYANKKISFFGSRFIYLNSVLSIFIGLWGVRLSQTRSASIALLPLVIFSFYLLWKQTRYRWLLAGVASLLFALALPIKRNFSDGLLFQDDNMTERLKKFTATWEWICSHPFFGGGFNLQYLLHSLPNTIRPYWYPHNLLLDVLGIGGLFLLTPLLVFVLSIVRLIWVKLSISRADDPLFLVFVFLWIQSILLSCFSGHMTLLPGFWVGGLMILFTCSRESAVVRD